MVLEKMMASLKVQNKQLKEKYDIEKQQNQKYKVSHRHREATEPEVQGKPQT